MIFQSLNNNLKLYMSFAFINSANGLFEKQEGNLKRKSRKDNILVSMFLGSYFPPTIPYTVVTTVFSSHVF